jgi:hypothetical protein
MTSVQLEVLIGSVKAANLRGVLYPRPESKRARLALERLTREGKVVAVPGTATSLPGYCAVSTKAAS